MAGQPTLAPNAPRQKIAGLMIHGRLSGGGLHVRYHEGSSCWSQGSGGAFRVMRGDPWDVMPNAICLVYIYCIDPWMVEFHVEIRWISIYIYQSKNGSYEKNQYQSSGGLSHWLLCLDLCFFWVFCFFKPWDSSLITIKSPYGKNS